MFLGEVDWSVQKLTDIFPPKLEMLTLYYYLRNSWSTLYPLCFEILKYAGRRSLRQFIVAPEFLECDCMVSDEQREELLNAGAVADVEVNFHYVSLRPW